MKRRPGVVETTSGAAHAGASPAAGGGNRPESLTTGGAGSYRAASRRAGMACRLAGRIAALPENLQ